MRRVLLVAALVLVGGVGGCGGRKPAPDWRQITASEAVKVLRGDDSPYRIIYTPPVDLAKKQGS
jgi:hypothetical protein